MSPMIQLGAIIAAALVYALDRFGYLPKSRTSVESAAELKIKDQMIERLRRERNDARDEKVALANVRFVEPVLEALKENAKLQAESSRIQSEILDRLAYHNGSFRHMEESLKVLAEFIAEVAGATPHTTKRRRKVEAA